MSSDEEEVVLVYQQHGPVASIVRAIAPLPPEARAELRPAHEPIAAATLAPERSLVPRSQPAPVIITPELHRPLSSMFPPAPPTMCLLLYIEERGGRRTEQLRHGYYAVVLSNAVVYRYVCTQNFPPKCTIFVGKYDIIPPSVLVE